jgi:hypothetical protein
VRQLLSDRPDGLLIVTNKVQFGQVRSRDRCEAGCVESLLVVASVEGVAQDAEQIHEGDSAANSISNRYHYFASAARHFGDSKLQSADLREQSEESTDSDSKRNKKQEV